jgi:hypothetical protein
MPPAASDKKVLRLNMALPSIILPSIFKAIAISRGADGCCDITGSAAFAKR